MNLKEDFIKWLDSNIKKKTGAKSSYIRAIELLETPLGYNVFDNKDTQSLELLYKDLLVNQTDVKGKYYNAKTPSYSQHRYYSAGIAKYIEFIKEIEKQNMAKFSWVKTHIELTSYLKGFRNKQVELINILKKNGVTGFTDKDKNSQNISLEEIDPFTFFCYIYKYGPERRLQILQNIAKQLNLHFPEDDLGIPSSNAQKVWLFPFKELRVNNEIERLWSFFFSVLDNNITNENFEDLLNIRGIARTKLTEALFNVNPEKFFPINGPTKPYIKEVFGIDPKFKTFDDYKSILNQLKSKTAKPFYELSHEAWLWNESNNSRGQKKPDSNISYWLYAPGRNAEHWEEFYNLNIMAIGWDEIGDLHQYKTKDEIRDSLRTAYGGEGNKMNNVTANFEFANTFKIGDVVIAKRGRSKLLGYGVVTSGYFYDEGRENYTSCRTVDWKIKGEWDSEHSLALKTLTDITKYDSEYEGYDKYYEYLMGIMNGDDGINTIIKMDVNATNQILYGPPGTGKTFYLKDQLFDKYTSRETSISQEQNFETVVSGCSWWQVIAIALLDIGSSKVSDIFEHDWVQKKASLSNSKTVRPTLWGQLQSHTIEECEFVNVSNRQQPLIFNKTEDSFWEILEDQVEELVPELFDLRDSVVNFNPDPDKIIKYFDFVTFHQSFAYEDFIEGIKPILPENGEESKELGYTIEDGIFKNLCNRAKNDPENRYAIFIDEINRGNVSAIFGELITLIEVDKRFGAKNELSIKLPYSKTEFSVPSNLDIYGTMNTADRSVEALDTALRRRFEFKEMMPDLDVIKEEIVEDIKLSKVLETINKRIELLIDRDHTIGHSYFVNVDSTQKLADAFNNKIVPLLQEYFYGDYGKIGLVLGQGFVDKLKNDKIEFANFDYESANDFITPTCVLKQVKSTSVIDAVNDLLGNSNVKETL